MQYHFADLIGEKSASMKSASGVIGRIGIPWNSNQAMNDCMDDDDRRRDLVNYFSTKRYKNHLHAKAFLKECFTEDMLLHVHSTE